MRRVFAVAMGLASLAWFSFIAVPGMSAFSLANCSLTVTSMDESGAVISSAAGGGPGGTRDDPLVVDAKGTVEWTGTTGGSPLTGTSYHVEIFGVPTPLQGAAKDDGPRSSTAGSIRIADFVPFDLVGLIYVSGALEVGGSPHCEGSGWIQLRGDPVGTPGFVGGAGLALVGLATALASVPRRHPFRGALAGLIGGAGLALLSGVTGFLPLDEQTPLVEVIGAVVLGLLLGVIDFGSLFGGGSVAAVDRAARTDGDTSPSVQPASPLTGQPAEPPTGSHPTPVVPPVSVQPPVVAPPPGPASAQATTPASPAPQRRPGLDTIHAGVDALSPDLRPEVAPLLQQAEAILHAGPGTLAIGADVIGRILAQAGPDIPAVHLTDGAITFGDGLMAPQVTPVVEQGRVTYSLDVAGEAAEAMGKLDGLKAFLENLNRAVADAGQRVTSVSITPSGVAITTGPATP